MGSVRFCCSTGQLYALVCFMSSWTCSICSARCTQECLVFGQRSWLRFWPPTFFLSAQTAFLLLQVPARTRRPSRHPSLSVLTKPHHTLCSQISSPFTNIHLVWAFYSSSSRMYTLSYTPVLPGHLFTLFIYFYFITIKHVICFSVILFSLH